MDSFDATARKVLDEMRLKEARLTEKIVGRCDSIERRVDTRCDELHNHFTARCYTIQQQAEHVFDEGPIFDEEPVFEGEPFLSITELISTGALPNSSPPAPDTAPTAPSTGTADPRCPTSPPSARPPAGPSLPTIDCWSQLKQPIGMYNTTCKETINTKQRAKVMHSMKLEETKHTGEAARAVADMYKAKCRAIMEAAAVVQRLVDLEAQRRRTAEVRATELHRSNLACPEQLVIDTATFVGTTNNTVQIVDISLELGVPLHLIKELVQRGPVDVTNSYIRSIWRMHNEEEVVPNTLPNRCLMNCFIGGLDVGSHLWANNSTAADHDRVGLRLLWWLKNHTSFQRFGSWDHFIMLGHIFIDLEPLIHSQSTIKHILAIIASISNA
jgi:hypothetical protein